MLKTENRAQQKKIWKRIYESSSKNITFEVTCMNAIVTVFLFINNFTDLAINKQYLQIALHKKILANKIIAFFF